MFHQFDSKLRMEIGRYEFSSDASCTTTKSVWCTKQVSKYMIYYSTKVLEDSGDVDEDIVDKVGS